MLETIDLLIGLMEIILSFYIFCFVNQNIKPMKDKKLLLRYINKSVNQEIVVGILFTISAVLGLILGKEIWIILLNIVCGLIWLNYAKKSLKMSNKIQNIVKK